LEGKPGDEFYKYGIVLKVWDIATGKERTLSIEWEKRRRITSLDLSPDGALLAVFLRTGGVEVLDVVFGEVIKRLTGDSRYARIKGVSFSPDSQSLAAVGEKEHSFGNKLFLWEVPSGKRVQAIAGDFWSKPVFSPDGALIATYPSENHGIVLWEVATGEQYKVLFGGAGPVAFSPDGKLMVTGGKDGTVLVWVR